MNHLQLGIVAESTGLPLRAALAEAAKAGAEGVQADIGGEFSPEKLTDTGRREVRNLLRSYGLQLAALNVPLRRGLDVAENLQPRIEHVRKAMQLAFDLGSKAVVVPCPKVPDDETTPRAQLLREALTAIGPHGDRVGSVLALEIGFDPAEKVRDYLATYDTGSLKVTYDPANMLMHGHDPLKNLMPLKGWLAHCHARDARSASLSRGMQEVPLGTGDVEWMAFCTTLNVLDFDGFLTVEREGARPAELAAAVKFLRRFASPLGV